MDDQRTAVVVGDVMLDKNIDGPLTRISPEAPAPVLLNGELTYSPGGAANVAMNVAGLGRRVQLIGYVGDDADGRRLFDLLDKAEDVWPRFVPWDGATTCKTRITSGGQQILRVDDEDPGDVASGNLLPVFVEALQAAEIGVVIISDYNKGALASSAIGEIMKICQSRGLPVFVNAKPANLANYRGATAVVLNFAEALEAAESAVHPGLWAGTVTDKAAVAAQWIAATYALPLVVVTAGADGAVLAVNGEVQQYPATARHVYDVTGAGDTFLAALAVGFLAGRPAGTAVQEAVIAAGLAVQEHGTVAVTRDNWEDALLAADIPTSKLMSLEQVERFSMRAKRRLQRVVLVTGRFDRITLGHFYCLFEAKRLGDKLVVALAGDAAFKATPPVFPEALRWLQVAANTYVDSVALYQDSPLEVLKAVKPDYLVTGEEYRYAAPPWADFVATHGGAVHFVPMWAGEPVPGSSPPPA